VAGGFDGRPVVISGSSDRTVRVGDLATGTPDGDPFTGHGGSVRSVAAGEVDGRPMVISGSSDETMQVWDLATGTPIGDPLTGHDGPVIAVVSRTTQNQITDNCPVYVGVATRNIVTVSTIRFEDSRNLRWDHILASEVRSDILALAFTSGRSITVAAELGIVVLDLPSTTK
jgi:WD40 repeat protein